MNDISRINRIEDLYQEISESIGLVKIDHCQKNLESLAMSLDKFFSGTHCDRVIFTYNPDKLFFVLIVMPIIDADDIVRTIHTDFKLIVKTYYLEIDSRLFEDDVSLTDDEITALIMHDVSAMVSDSSPAEEVKRAIDRYLEDNHEVLKLSPSIHYKEILSYGFRDAMRKTTTIFERSQYNENDVTVFEILGPMYAGFFKNAFDKVEAIIYSMTEQERKHPELIDRDYKRRERIAKGSGRSIQEVNKLRQSLDQMKASMKQMKNMSETDAMRLEQQMKNGNFSGFNQGRANKGKGKGKGNFRY